MKNAKIVEAVYIYIYILESLTKYNYVNIKKLCLFRKI